MSLLCNNGWSTLTCDECGEQIKRHASGVDVVNEAEDMGWQCDSVSLSSEGPDFCTDDCVDKWTRRYYEKSGMTVGCLPKKVKGE